MDYKAEPCAGTTKEWRCGVSIGVVGDRRETWLMCWGWGDDIGLHYIRALGGPSL
jgi:hypothetical protein